MVQHRAARLGDVLSQLYICSSMLKRYEDEGRPATEQPLLAWAFHDSVHKIELAMSGVLRNFPIRPVGYVLWMLIFPWGRRAQPPLHGQWSLPGGRVDAGDGSAERASGDVYRYSLLIVRGGKFGKHRLVPHGPRIAALSPAGPPPTTTTL